MVRESGVLTLLESFRSKTFMGSPIKVVEMLNDQGAPITNEYGALDGMHRTTAALRLKQLYPDRYREVFPIGLPVIVYRAMSRQEEWMIATGK